jgi:tetratricopeptide (TPR) repeat protein
LQEAYEKSQSEEILLTLVSMMEADKKKSDYIISLLRMHTRMHRDVSDKVYGKLLGLYVRKNDIDGVISVYQALYERNPTQMILQRLMQAYALKRDYEGAMHFLERHADDAPEILYDLYKSLQYFDKAAALSDKLYRRTKDPKWLAEKAIMLYEGAENKKDKAMLMRMAKLFERAFKEGEDDSTYLNYYGYTLIDNDMNVARGIELLHRALKQQPANAYYLDSLAWGYYKQGHCAKAYDVMEKVVRQAGLSQPEIAQHWKVIRQCATSSAADAHR